jgi:hypothetical protein
VGPGGSPRQHL